MKRTILILAAVLVAAVPATPVSGGHALKAEIRAMYPSLLYVDRYRSSFPADAQGVAFWHAAASAPEVANATGLVRTLVALEDQHVALAGPSAGKPETLGVLFRTADDGSAIAWRIFDAAATGVVAGDRLVAVNGVPARTWLTRAAALTFGGNRGGRYAEAALDLGMATGIVHRVAGLDASVQLRLARADGISRTITLRYVPVNGARAATMAKALETPDLPARFTVDGKRVGTVRIGAFAPQFDPVFNDAVDRASKPGVSDDAAMVAGYCAVVRSFIHRFDAIASTSQVMIVDLRGNLGGFDREARLEAEAISTQPPAPAYDLFATSTPGMVRLTAEPIDASCGHVRYHRPLLVLDDAGTRSSGELMTAWLWGSGATIAGERTAGAGGGFEFGSDGFAVPGSSYRVRVSGNFTLFDRSGMLRNGDWPEKQVVGVVAQDGFRPSLRRPFAFQSVGIQPDLALRTTGADLRDGGLAEAKRAVIAARNR